MHYSRGADGVSRLFAFLRTIFTLLHKIKYKIFSLDAINKQIKRTIYQLLKNKYSRIVGI